jgi:outer membrane protein
VLQNNLKLTKLQLAAAQEAARKAHQQLFYDVKQAYYNVWLANQLLQVQQASYHNLDQHLTRMQSRYRAEVVSRLDVIRAETQRDTLKPKVINAQNQLVLAKLQLATLIAYPTEQVYEVLDEANQADIPEAVTQTLTHVLDQAYQERPELKQLKYMAESNKVLTTMKEASYRPNVAVSAGYGGIQEDLYEGDWTGAWMLTFSVGGKIYDRALEAKQSLQNLATAIANTRASQASINLAQETLRMTQIRVDNGMATTMDIMDAQLALDQALTGYYQGVVAYLTDTAKLDLVMGRD